jgi:hypothetical protein
MEARRQAEAAQRDQAATAARRALEEAVKRNKAETELAVMPSAKQVPTGRHCTEPAPARPVSRQATADSRSLPCLGNADVRTHRVMPHRLIEGGGEKTASANRRSNLATKISDFHNKIGTLRHDKGRDRSPP